MSKFRVVSLVASSLLVSSLMAETQVIDIKSGWNLIGSKLDSATIEANGDISDTWKYKDKKWENNNLTLSAGDGFWLKSKNISKVNLNGTASTKNLDFSTYADGWYLLSPISKDLELSSLDSTTFSEIWTFDGKEWLDKSKITTIKVNEGFWLKKGDSVATTSLVKGKVDLSSILLPGTSTSRNARGAALPGLPDEATVQIYSVDDQNYTEPLLTEGVSIDSDGNYEVTDDSLTEDAKVKLPGMSGFIVRVVAKKDDSNYELTALKTKDQTTVDVNPITTAVKSQIIDTIKAMFGEDFAKEMGENSTILTAINTLADAVASKVEQDISDGKLTLREADFQTTKTPQEFKKQAKEDDAYLQAQAEKDEKLKTQLKDSSASTDVAKFENEVSYEKKTQFLKNTNASDIDISKSATNVDIAIMEYDIISTFAKMNLAVHDGNGRLVLFLPVPPEDFDKLPGEKFKLKVKKSDGSEFVVGDDPAIRAIDLEKSLKNANGSEKWAYELIDTLLNSPIVPFEVIKTLVKKDLYESELGKLGTYLQDQIAPDGTNLFDSNPLAKLIQNKVELSSDAESSVKKIIREYIKPLLGSNLLWMQDDFLFSALDKKDSTKFMKLFGIQDGDTQEDFISRMQNSQEFNYILKDVGVPLIHGIPPMGPSEATMQFKDGYTINADSTILPRTGIALTNMLMATSGLTNIIITKKKVSDIVGDYLPDSAKNLADKEIWWAEENADKNQRDTTTTNQDEIGWLKDFIIGLASELSGEKITAETRFSKVLSDVKKHVREFQKKVQEREKDFFKENLAKSDKIDSVVTFQLVDFDEVPITDVSKVTFIPHIENRKTHEIKPLENSSKSLTPIDTEARFKKRMTIYSPDAFVNKEGEITENGEWQYLTDYNVKITLSDDTEFYLDHPVALFPIADNNLNYIYVDKNLDIPSADGGQPVDEFHYQVLTNGDNVFYPLLNRELATYNNLNFTAMSGVKFGILAENWQQQMDLDIWNAPVIPKPKESELINEFKVTFGDGISEGALVMVDVSQNSKLRQEYGNTKLLMTIDYADEMSGEVGVAIEPMPQDNFSSDFIGDKGTPQCPTGVDENGNVTYMDLPQKSDGTYPFPDDPEYPKECQTNIAGDIPTCFDATNQKDVALKMRPDGTYPWPGDPDYPKECLTNVTDIIPTDCQGKEFPYDEATGKYIYPENEMFPTDQYDLSCMTQGYFDTSFQGQIGDRPNNINGEFMQDKCDFNGDGTVDDTEKQQCVENGVDTASGMYQDKCDFNGDGTVDDTEKQQCVENGVDTATGMYQDKCDFNGDGTVDDTEKQQCVENGVDTATGMYQDKCDFNGDGTVDDTEKQQCVENGVDTASGMYQDKCDFNGDGTVDDTEKQQCVENGVDIIANNNNTMDNTAQMCGEGEAPYLANSDMTIHEFNYSVGDYVEINLNDYFAFNSCSIKKFGMVDWESDATSTMMAKALREMGDFIDGLALDNDTGIYSGTIADSEAGKTFKVKVNASNENGTSADITFVFYIGEATSSANF